MIDSSALIAILLQETEAQALTEAIENDPIRLISATNWLESQMVLTGRFGTHGGLLLETMFRELRLEIVPLDAAHLHAAFAAWQNYGKGRHPASLNLGDCCAYATALLRNQKLLYKGNDFSATDIGRVMY